MQSQEFFGIKLFVMFMVGFSTFFMLTSVDFSGNQITGNTVASGFVFFNILETENCVISFNQGWNLISVCANATNTTISQVFNETNSSIRFVLEWNESAQEFIVYSPQQTDPPFETLNLNRSYFVFYDDTAGNESVEGNTFGDLNISMTQGYFAPAYPYGFHGAVESYLDSIENKYSYALKWNSSGQAFLVYSPAATTPEYTQMEKGQGQFILVTDPGGALLQYNKTKVRYS